MCVCVCMDVQEVGNWKKLEKLGSGQILQSHIILGLYSQTVKSNKHLVNIVTQRNEGTNRLDL